MTSSIRPMASSGNGDGSRRRRVRDPLVINENDVRKWFGEYLDTFAACGRGEGDAGSLLAYYGVPLLITTDAGLSAMTSEDQVLGVAQQQIDGMRAASYDHTDVLQADVTVLNGGSALYRGEFSRVGADGNEISRPRLSYLVTDGPIGRRISALLIHSA